MNGVDATPPGVKRWEGPPLEAWRAWSPHEAAERLRGFAAPWCVVGGWAIDLFVGATTRAHGDLEIAIPRPAFARMRTQLSGFALYVPGDGELRKLADDEEPPLDRHQNWVLDTTESVWRMDVMLEPGDATTWVYRRDARLTAPRKQMVALRDGIPYLQPQGALLFKAKYADLAKSESDLNVCLPHLTPDARAWLRNALALMHPGHAWIERLA